MRIVAETIDKVLIGVSDKISALEVMLEELKGKKNVEHRRNALLGAISLYSILHATRVAYGDS